MAMTGSPGRAASDPAATEASGRVATEASAREARAVSAGRAAMGQDPVVVSDRVASEPEPARVM